MEQSFFDSEIFKWVVVPILIFIARMCDVTLGTLRNVFISKGLRKIVPVLGFFEVLIWLISIRYIMRNLDNPMCYIGFASGFAMGTFVGLGIESRLALGMQVLRIITTTDPHNLIEGMQMENMGVTIIDGQGAKGPVKIILAVFHRKDTEKIQEIIKKHNPQAFYSIEDVRIAAQGVFPKSSGNSATLDYVKRIFPVSPRK